MALSSLGPVVGSWLAALANPQGSCGGKSLAGSVGVAGVCWVWCDAAGDSREWPCLPWPPLPSLSTLSCNVHAGSHIKCRNGQGHGCHDWPMGTAGACRMRKGAARLEGLPYVTLRK